MAYCSIQAKTKLKPLNRLSSLGTFIVTDGTSNECEAALEGVLPKSFWRRRNAAAAAVAQFELNLNSEVETADDADDADNQELGGESGRMSPKLTPQTKPVYHP